MNFLKGLTTLDLTLTASGRTKTFNVVIGGVCGGGGEGQSRLDLTIPHTFRRYIRGFVFMLRLFQTPVIPITFLRGNFSACTMIRATQFRSETYIAP